MKKELSFLLLFLFIFSSLLVGYIAFSFHFSGFHSDQKYTAQLEKKVQRLQMALKKQSPYQTTSKTRTVASLPPKEISLDKVYFENLRNLKNSSNLSEEKLKLLSQKILQSSPESEALAETYFLMAQLNCEKFKKEDNCLSQIETLVSQFPESTWTGRGLLLLSQLYLKMNRTAEARSVLTVIKKEFPKDQDLARQVMSVEKNQF